MRKNVPGQPVGCDMISASDGSAFAGAVTIYVCGDNGAQVIGQTGVGVCAYKGNGYHSYVCAQAETNYDFIAFTFVGSGAIPRTVEIDTELTAAQIAAAVCDEALAGHVTAGTVGAKLNALTFTGTNRLDANLTALNNDPTAAANLARAAAAIYVGSVTGSPTATSWVDSALPGAVDGHWNGSVAILLSTALKGAKSTVLASVVSSKTLTLKSDEPLPAVPQIGDVYVLV